MPSFKFHQTKQQHNQQNQQHICFQYTLSLNVFVNIKHKKNTKN